MPKAEAKEKTGIKFRGAGLTAGRLRELLSYDLGTGLFRWKTSRGRVRAGSIAGFAYGCDSRYVGIGVDGSMYLAHRLAWLYIHGEWPIQMLDHKNALCTDNRIKNLRQVCWSVNGQNRPRSDRDSRTGLLGVSMSRGLWKAAIGIAGKTIMLGRFPTPELAQAAYLKAKAKYHPGWECGSAPPA